MPSDGQYGSAQIERRQAQEVRSSLLVYTALISESRKKSTSSRKQHDEDDLQGHQVASGSHSREREGSGTPVKTAEDNQAEMDHGKTEAEKRFFAVQRKRVRYASPMSPTWLTHRC